MKSQTAWFSLKIRFQQPPCSFSEIKVNQNRMSQHLANFFHILEVLSEATAPARAFPL